MREEVVRRAVHFSGTVVPVAYLAVPAVEWHHLQWLVGVGAVLAAVLELLRLSVGLDWKIYDMLTREYEHDNPAGYALAVVSAAAVAWLFVPEIAVPALLMLTIADPVSGLLGSGGVGQFKEWWVVVATFLLCVVLGYLPALPVWTVDLDPLPAWAVVPAALVATLADASTPRVGGYVVDDNFSIPVGAAVTAFLAVTVVSMAT